MIAASFVIAGVGSYLIPDRNLDPAKVNDVKIPEHELENQVRREKAMLERQFGKQFFEKQMAVDPQFNNKFKASILEKLINDEALAQHIKKVGIDIPASLVKAKIMSMPEFMVDGKFSQEQYEKVLSMYGYMTGEVFGETLRNNMVKFSILLMSLLKSAPTQELMLISVSSNPMIRFQKRKSLIITNRTRINILLPIKLNSHTFI